MRLFRSARWLLLAVLVSLIPAASHASVLISVGIAPPPLVVYDQPPCPQPGWMWEPGYWAYGPAGYYWVPGTWVAAPEPGLYWTPGYWGFATGLYVWHPGYWGPHVGYYGGVNYGFGFFGVGFVGGAWHGRVFAYNTAVVHVNSVYVHNVYVDRTVIRSHTIVNNHVSFNGGPGGINHMPTPQERSYMSERHIAATAAQRQHAQAAMQDHNAYFNNNHGHPARTAAARPITTANRASFAQNRSFRQNRPAQNERQMQRPENNRSQERERPMQQRQSRPARQQEHGNDHHGR